MAADASPDVVVIGAGAAGLVAALRAAELGKRTLLLEKNKRPGVKILMSGGTRCNVTQATDNRGIVRAYAEQGKFLHSALASLSVQATIALFEDEGLALKTEETGKIFPQSDKAADVLAALLRRLDRSGAELALNQPVTSIVRDGDAFVVHAVRGPIRTPRIVLTTGGKSFPGCGTTGDGYAWAAALGHTIVPTRPALVPLTSMEPWVRELSGLTLPDVELAIRAGDATLAARRSSLLFAHFGLTGPAALDVSRAVTGHAKPSSLAAEIDLLPDFKEAALEEQLREEAAANGKKQLSVLISASIPRRAADCVLRQAEIPPDRKLAELGKDERRRLLRGIKRWRIPLSGALGFEKAEVTAGGVSRDEVDSRTMQSKLVPGLFFAGEVLDLDGPIGGYNFQAAWSTGWLAGGSV
ncbi:MAG: NAD(P)/FAD-dependent oxidoreductase [Pirellulales bacterium]